MAVNLNLSAWTSSNEGVCYTMDTLTTLSPNISYNTMTGIFEVHDNIIILENDTLKILPNEIVKFIQGAMYYYGIEIYGCFIAIGNKDQQIILGDPEYNISNGNIWCGIQFYNTSTNGESKLKYCNLIGAINIPGDEWEGNADVGIFCENSSPIIDHCHFSYTISALETGGGSAIACRGQSFPIVSYCKFEHLYNSIAIWCNPWYSFDTTNYPSPLVFGCNILPSVTGFFFWPIDNDVIIYRGGFIDNCYLGVNSYSADTTLGFPVDTVGDGICTTTSTYDLQPRFLLVDGVVNPRDTFLITGLVEEEIDLLPTTTNYLILKNNYPNPFSNFTTIEFEVKSNNANISLMVYNSTGRLVKQLIKNKIYHYGDYTIKWYGDNDAGQKVPKGIYFYKLISNKHMLVKKAIIVK